VSLVDYSDSASETDGVTIENLHLRYCHICHQNFRRVVDFQVHFQQNHPTYYNEFGQSREGETINPLSIEVDNRALDSTYQDYRVALENCENVTIEMLFRRV